MILLKSNQLNKIVVTLTQNTTLCNPEYLFYFVHIFSKETVAFILPNVSPHPTRYDEFEFVEGTGVGQIPFPYEGQYNYYVYAQPQGSGNLNPTLATELVENGIGVFIVVADDTTNENYFEFISSDEFNSNTIFAPDEINPPTPSVTAGLTPTPTPSITASPTATHTPTQTNTPTHTPTQTPTPTPTATHTPTQTPTNTETPTNTPSQTPSITPTNTETPTNTPSQTPSITPTNTETPTNTPSQTPSITPTNTETPTTTPTPTPTLTQTPTNTGTPTPTPSSTPPASGTTEANTYLRAVVDAGGTGITPTVSAATVTLFTSLVSNGLYDKLTAFYPMLGGNSNGCKFNAKNPLDTNAAYRLVFNGGWTYNASGATSNGSNAYADSYLSPSALTLTQQHVSIYLGNNSMPAGTGRCYIGCAEVVSGNQAYFVISQDGTPNWYNGLSNGGQTILATSTQGMLMLASNGTNFNQFYRNGSLISNFNGASTFTMSRSIFVGAMNNGTPIQYYGNQYRFITIGSGLSGAEVSTLSTIINTFQTTLGRNVY